MAKINIVLEGRYKGRNITLHKNYINIWDDVKKSDVSSYTIIDETNKEQYSFWKGALGVAILGGWGAVAGLGGKNKKEYMVVINWIYPKNMPNNKSLIIIDEKCYEILVKSMF